MLPPTVVKKLNDHFGQYAIHVRCKSCNHGREIQPVALARIFGWDAELSVILRRMRCSKCGRREPDATIGFDRKPKGWINH
jgi:hypothetical protein